MMILRGLLIVIMASFLTGCIGGGGGGGSSTSDDSGDSGIERVARTTYAGPTRGPSSTPVPSSPTAAITVTSTADSGAGTLRAALEAIADGQVIAFDPSLAGATIQPATTLVTPNDISITITAKDAPGLAISGSDTRRILQLGFKSSPTIIGITFKNGRAIDGTGDDGEGGAIRSGFDGALTLQHCTFQDNVANRGGAVRTLSRADLTVEDCSFIGNDGSRINDDFSAGAISTGGQSELIIRRSWFEDNLGVVGGAVYNSTQPVTIEDSIFLWNASTDEGGAIYLDEVSHNNGTSPAGHLYLRRCWFQDNATVGTGGAIHLFTNHRDEVIFEDTVFTTNRVERDASTQASGGAVFMWGSDRGDTPVTATFQRCAFVDNHADAVGGGLSIDSKQPTVFSDLTFHDNNAGEGGGGMYLKLRADALPSVIRHCTFTDNHGVNCCGALLLPDHPLDIVIANSIVANNTATNQANKQQIGVAPQTDGGGNLEWPAPSGGNTPVAAGAIRADPLLAPISLDGDMLIRELTAGSPAKDGGVNTNSSPTDSRGQSRSDGAPDIGSVELPSGGT